MREDIEKLIVKNEQQIENIPGTYCHSDIDIALGDKTLGVLQYQNSKLRAILDAHR